MFLSIVVPAYNEQRRLLPTLRATWRYLCETHPASEVIVVDDGSTDQTRSVFSEFAREACGQGCEPELRLVGHGVRRGAGAALQTGVLQARGEYVLCMDADLSTPMSELGHLLDVLRRCGMDVVVGSRALDRSLVRRTQPWLRRVMGRAFNRLVRALLFDGFYDTQCGFKVFTHAAAHDVFSKCTIAGFAAHVELIMLAQDLGYRVSEAPVQWAHSDKSKVSIVRDSTRMFFDVLRLRWRRSRNHSLLSTSAFDS